MIEKSSFPHAPYMSLQHPPGKVDADALVKYQGFVNNVIAGVMERLPNIAFGERMTLPCVAVQNGMVVPDPAAIVGEYTIVEAWSLLATLGNVGDAVSDMCAALTDKRYIHMYGWHANAVDANRGAADVSPNEDTRLIIRFDVA